MAKTTFIIRRMDDLGRVAIPKEIRKRAGLVEGDPLEIFIDEIGGQPAICFVKYEANPQGISDKLFTELETMSPTGCLPADLIRAQNTINLYIKENKEN